MYGDHMLEKHFVAGQDSVFGFLYDTNYLSSFSVHFIDGTLSLSQHCWWVWRQEATHWDPAIFLASWLMSNC